MATTNIISLPAPRKAPMTPAERAAAYRARKKNRGVLIDTNGRENSVTPSALTDEKTACAGDRFPSQGRLAAAVPFTDTAGGIRADAPSRSVTPVTAPVTPVTSRVTPSRISPASILLSVAALALGAVGITMNGWFARSLGSTEIAGWLFLAVGVAADAAALGLPSCAARFWQARQRGVALAGWLVWAATFAFALSASIGFASVNISDVTSERASRVTTAVTEAKAQLADAVTARDRECRGGVGKNCREREATVTERTNALNAALRSVAQAADPQTEAALKVVTFLSAGTLHPTSDHFALVRLLLLAFLPQVGGILLMLARTPT